MECGHVVDWEMVQHVYAYVQFVRARSRNRIMSVEKRLDFSKEIGVPNSFGTADAVLWGGSPAPIIIDLKYGKGIKVDAHDNKQLMMYALGLLNFLPPYKKYTMMIHQPRLGHISKTSVTRQQLLAFGEHAKTVAGNIIAGKTKYNPSRATCRFCKAKKDCLAYKKWSSEPAVDDFDVISAG